jgi:hypothetical protein
MTRRSPAQPGSEPEPRDRTIAEDAAAHAAGLAAERGRAKPGSKTKNTIESDTAQAGITAGIATRPT